MTLVCWSIGEEANCGWQMLQRDSAGESRKTPPFLNATPPKCHLLYYLTTAAPTLTELLSLDQVASNKNRLTQKSDI